jgi:hypothetical protein
MSDTRPRLFPLFWRAKKGMKRLDQLGGARIAQAIRYHLSRLSAGDESSLAKTSQML